MSNEDLNKLREACRKLGRGLTPDEYCQVLGMEPDTSRTTVKRSSEVERLADLIYG
jgi:hypothetical protein